MTTPAPPAPPPRDLRPVVAFIGGVALVLAVTVVLLLINDDTTTPTAAAVTTAATTTTAPTTSPTLPILFESHFDDTSFLTPYTAPDAMAIESTPDGRGKFTALTGATCIGFYGANYGDVEVSFTVASDSMGTGTRFGALVFAELEEASGHYVAVTLDPAFRTIHFDSYSSDGGFLAIDEVPIPVEAGYDPEATTAVTLRLQGGAITASINGFPVTTWNGPTEATSGMIGFILYPDAVGHTAIFDDLVVRAL